jgi:hypothetical protein
MEIWYELVSQYTTCQLSFASDRLPALAGIISRFQEILGDVRLHGLWKKTLLQHLLWNRTWEKTSTPLRLAEAGAPSWSWASLQAAVSYPLSDLRLELVAHVLMTPRTKRTTEAIRLRLCLRAPMLKAICSHKLSFFEDPSNVGVFVHRIRMDMYVQYDGSRGDLDDIAVEADQEPPHRADESERECFRGPFYWIYFLFVSTPPVAGIILKRGRFAGHYARIGFFHGYGKFGAHTRDLGLYLENTHEIVEDDYHESHGGGIYTVTLVYIIAF